MAGEKIEFAIKGKAVEGVEDWQTISLNATFDSLNSQASISSDSFLLVRDARDIVWQDIQDGNIFIARDFAIRARDRFTNDISVFGGFISENLELINNNQKGIPTKISARIIKNNSIETLETLLGGTTYGYLYDQGVIRDSDGRDVNIITVELNPGEKLLIAAIMGYSVVVNINQLIRDTANNINTAIGIASGSLTGSVGAAIFAVLSAIANLAFIAVLSIALSDLVQTVYEILLPSLRKHRALSLRQLLEIPLNHFGFQLDSNISELDSWFILPSNTDGERNVKNPTLKPSDFGYRVIEIFNYVIDQFYARTSVMGNTVTIKHRLDESWFTPSGVKLADVKPDSFRYNTEELFANRIISYDFDLSDEYTITDRKDAIYQIVTAQSSKQPENKDLIKGFEDITFPYALSSRKDELSAVEKSLKDLAGTIDDLLSVVGVRSNLAGKIRARIGAVKVSQTTTNKAKIIPLSGSNLPANYKSLLNAKYVDDNFYYAKSFVRSNFVGQKKLTTLNNVPFTLNDFVKTTEKGLIELSNGVFAEVEELTWELATQTAEISYKEPFVYTKKLKEIFIENE